MSSESRNNDGEGGSNLNGVNHDNEGWATVGSRGRVVHNNMGGQPVQSFSQQSRFKLDVRKGLKNAWFDQMREAERLEIKEAQENADVCPKTILAIVPIGYHGNQGMVMDGIRVSLAKTQIDLGAQGGVRRVKVGVEGGDVRISPKECATLYSIKCEDKAVKEAILAKGSIDWLKKDKYGQYRVVNLGGQKGNMKIRFQDLATRTVKLAITGYEPELNEKYDDAIKDAYSDWCGVDRETIKIEEGTRKQEIPPDGVGESPEIVEIYDGRKYVIINFPQGVTPKGMWDGKVTLNLAEVGQRNVWVSVLGKKYPCKSCGGSECERFFCMKQCMHCGRDTRGGHMESMCSERHIMTKEHVMKARDIQEVMNKRAAKPIIAGRNRNIEGQVKERDEQAIATYAGVAAQKTRIVERVVKEARIKSDMPDTPYEQAHYPGGGGFKAATKRDRELESDQHERMKQALFGKSTTKVLKVGETDGGNKDTSDDVDMGDWSSGNPNHQNDSGAGLVAMRGDPLNLTSGSREQGGPGT